MTGRLPLIVMTIVTLLVIGAVSTYVFLVVKGMSPI